MRIARVFLESDLRMGFDGLISFAKKKGKDLEKIEDESALVFVNRKATSFKILTGSKYLVYWRSTHRIPLEALSNLPVAFGGKTFDFNKSIEKTLRDKFTVPQ